MSPTLLSLILLAPPFDLSVELTSSEPDFIDPCPLVFTVSAQFGLVFTVSPQDGLTFRVNECECE